MKGTLACHKVKTSLARPRNLTPHARVGLSACCRFALASRVAYAVSGFGLMAFKYGVESGLIYFYTGKFFAPYDFLNPLLSMRQQFLVPPAPEWLGWALFVWTLPFLWIAVSMSVRRTADAGATAWLGLLVLMPGINFIVMALLCALPGRESISFATQKPQAVVDHRVRSALLGIVVSIVISLLMLVVSVYAFADYGVALFLGTPILVGVARLL